MVGGNTFELYRDIRLLPHKRSAYGINICCRNIFHEKHLKYICCRRNKCKNRRTVQRFQNFKFFKQLNFRLGSRWGIFEKNYNQYDCIHLLNCSSFFFKTVSHCTQFANIIREFNRALVDGLITIGLSLLLCTSNAFKTCFSNK